MATLLSVCHLGDHFEQSERTSGELGRSVRKLR